MATHTLRGLIAEEEISSLLDITAGERAVVGGSERVGSKFRSNCLIFGFQLMSPQDVMQTMRFKTLPA